MSFKQDLFLKALLGCAGKKDVRHYLNAVNVDEVDGALRFSASDGHIGLHVVFDSTVRDGFLPDVPAGSAGLLSRKSLEIAVRQKDAALSARAGAWAFGACGVSLVDSRFPDLPRVLSMGAGSKAAAEKGVDFTLLAQIAKALTDLQKAFGRMPCGIVIGRDATSPFVFTGVPCDGVKWEAALMPRRV